MPLNTKSVREVKGGGTTLVFDTFIAISRSTPVIVSWLDVTLAPEDHQTLRQLVGNLTSLGRAEGWVHAELTEGAALDWNCSPASATDSGQELVPVFCPHPDTAFGNEHYPAPPDAKKLKKGLKPADYLFDCPRWHLCLDTKTVHSERWPQVPGARWVSYARASDAFTRVASPFRQPSQTKCDRPTIARFLLDAPVLPLATDAIRVAEAFRRAVMGCFQRIQHRQKHGHANKPYLEQFRSEVLSGKDTAGEFLRSHGHARYLPTVEGDDDRRITHLTVSATDGFGPQEVAALTGLRDVVVGELKLRVQLIGLGEPKHFRASLFGPSREWLSATPFVPHRHLKRRGQRKDTPNLIGLDRRTAFLELTVRELIGRVGLGNLLGVESVEVVDRRRPFEFRRNRNCPGDDGLRRPCGFLKLTFAEPLDGPLCLGYGCHFGLGLFRPVQSPNTP
jgi:CRISPR-associated protein Csb2